MKTSFRVTLVLMSLVLLTGTLQADDHFIQEYNRTYMGNTTPIRTQEFWFNDNIVYMNFGNFITIKRFDLNENWVIFPRKKRFMIEPLEGEDEPGESNVRIQEKGFNYQPEFDWILIKTEQNKVINGFSCIKFIFEGDADYAEERREIWFTKEVPINIERYHQKLREPDLTGNFIKLYTSHPDLKGFFPVEEEYSTENAIAPTTIWNFRKTTIESADPPEGIYEIPEGYTCVKTRDELYAR